MKNTLKLFALVAFMFAAFATSAQTAKPIKLGHLDVQKVMTSMPEFKKAQDDLAAKEQEIRKELTAMHENYQKLMQEYQANAKTLTELSRTAKEQEIQGLAERIQNFQQLAQEQMAKTQEEYDKEASMGCADPTRALLMTRPAFGGNIMATLMCPRTKPQMATVRPGVMKRIDKDETRKGELIKFDVDFTEADMNVEILEVVKSDKKSVDLTEAKLIVSGGRGIGGPQGFDMIRDVADALGAEVGSSRACVDAGWIEKDRQVGQTGKTVRPDLYMACGISGAIQHVAGMEGSELVISINKNDTAPIFEVSDLGIVGDVKQILPKLADAIRKYKASKATN